ncbi:MAG: hypothetical protein ABL998_15140 [Planctomycetota bacterium]
MWLAALLLCLPIAQAPDEDARLRERAARCGSELTWAADWKSAAERAEAEHKLVLVSFQNYPGFELGELALIGPFMDPDIVALVEARLVPLRLKLDMESPLAAPEVYGMGPNTFGVALMLATPEGDVLAETFSLDSTVVYEFLREGLRAHPGPFEISQADLGPGGLALFNVHDARAGIQRLLAGGALERAEARIEWLAQREAPRLAELRADLARLRGDPRAGLAALAALPTDDPERLEREAGFLASLGEYDEAAARLARIATPSAAARFQRAMLALAREERAAGLAELRTLALEEPETRWSWLASALLLEPALTAVESFDLQPPSAATLAEGLNVARAPLAADQHENARAQAVAWLLAHQRADGSWLTPDDLGRGPRDDPDSIPLGITALAGLALVREARTSTDAARSLELRSAATRALGFLTDFAATLRARGTRAPEVLMDYTVWSHPCALLLAAESTQDDATRTLVHDALAELTRKKQTAGGWSYYLSGTVAGSATPYQISMSFTTALVLRALVSAHAHALAVDAALLEGAADALESMRKDDGRFAYLAEHTSGYLQGGERGDAAGRGPGCTLALLEVERAELDELRTSLAEFVAHLPLLEREQGKALMHCGPEGQGSHYLLFDYWQAGEAVAALPLVERAGFRTRVRAAVLAARNADGSFVDNPSVGRAAGTAMALLALQALARE